MKKYLDVLKKCALFNDISDEEILQILSCLGAKVDYFDKKYTVLREGSPAKYIGIVLSGEVQITISDYFGNRNIINSIHQGELFAEAFACAQVTSLPISVISSEASDIMFIDCSHILHTCSNNCVFHQQLIFNLMTVLATKSIMVHQRIEVTSKRTTRDKLLTYLSLFAKKTGGNSFDIPFDRQELADYLEVDRSGLSAEISKLRNEGILECRKNHFVIKLL